MHKLLLLFVFFASNIAGHSQSLNLTEINATKFPKVQVGFSPLNEFGDALQNINKSEIRVVENGIDLTSTIELECKGGNEPQELNVILVVDASGSMDNKEDKTKLRRFDWVEKAVKIFIDNFAFYKRSQVSIITFGGNSSIRCPFTQDSTELMDSLKKSILAGPTNYNTPMIGENNSVVTLYNGLSAAYKSEMKTVVIFLTDGAPTEFPVKQIEIGNKMNELAIQVYSITLLTELHASLEYISQVTGGRATRVDTEKDLIDIYKIIASEIQNKTFCILKWTSPYGCDPTSFEREVKITFTRNGSNNTKKYIAPETSLALTTFSDEVVSFGNPSVDFSTNRSFSFSADRGSMRITNFKFSPINTYFVIQSIKVKGLDVTIPFTLTEGDTAFVEMEFTQKDKIEYRFANFIIESTPCERTLPIYGGVSDVILLTPNSGFFKNCEDIIIKWAGVDKETPVDIYYSTNDGSTWVLLTKDATGLSFIWESSKFPTTGNKFRIRLDVLPISFYQFARSFGNSEENYARSLAITNDNLNLYFTGYYRGSIQFDNSLFTSKGAEDLYVVKTDNVGNVLWAKSAGGSARDTATGVAVDDLGNAYVVGTIKNKDVQFGAAAPVIEYDDLNVFFVAKYDSKGFNAPMVYTLGAKSGYTAFAAEGVKIKVTGTGNNTRIIATGNYTSRLQFAEGFNNFVLPPNQTQFKAEFDKDLKLLTLLGAPIGNAELATFQKDTVFSSDNELRYTVGSYTNTKDYPPFKLTSKGANDIYLTKFGKNKASSDISNNAFTIEAPTLKFEVANVDFGTQRFGQADSKIFFATLTNITNNPIKITNTYFATGNNTDFVISNIPNQINGLQTVDIELTFKPSAVGNRTTKLFIEAECANTIELIINGNANCNTQGIDLVNLGSSNLNIPKNQIVNSIFTNPNDGNLIISPIILNDPNNEFEILTINGNTYNQNAKLTVVGLEVIDIEIEFTAKSGGLRTANLDFRVENGCNNFVSKLQGNGIDADVFGDAILFNKKRIKTSNKEIIKLKNNGSLLNKIVSLELEDKTNYELVNLPSLPIDITSNGEIEIELLFKPITEVTYDTRLKFNLEGNSNDFYVDIQGIGVNPQLVMSFECPASPPKENVEENMNLILNNNSILENTNITSLRLSGTDYVFTETGNKILNNIPVVPFGGINNSIKIPIKFLPTGPGVRIVVVFANADISEGNSIDEKYPSTISINTDTIGCSARSAGGVEIVDFENVLYCDTREIIINIPINENTEDLIIDTSSPILFTGNDAINFTHNIDNSFTSIKIGETRQFKISFKPTENRVYNTTLTLPNNLGQNITFNITGSGVFIRLYSSDKTDVTVTPGNEIINTLFVSAEIPKLAKNPITELKVKMYFDAKMVYFPIDKLTNDIKKVNSILTNWTWNTPKLIAEGVLEITGTGILNTPFNSNLFTIDYQIYLGDSQVSEIKFASNVNECENGDYFGTKVTLGGVCFLNGRLVDFKSAYSFNLKDIAPNPTFNDININSSIAFETNTKIEVINYMGEIVSIPLDQIVKPGAYELILPVNEYSNGLYLIRIKSGPYLETKTFIINK